MGAHDWLGMIDIPSVSRWTEKQLEDQKLYPNYKGKFSLRVPL